MEVDDAFIWMPRRGQLPNVVVGRPIGKVKQSLQVVLRADVVAWEVFNRPRPRRSTYSADQRPMPRRRDR